MDIWVFPHFLAIVSVAAAINICAEVFVWTYIFISLEYIYLEVKLLNHMVILFN